MQQIELELAGGGVLTVSLRASLDAMPAVKERPLVLVVPAGYGCHTRLLMRTCILPWSA